MGRDNFCFFFNVEKYGQNNKEGEIIEIDTDDKMIETFFYKFFIVEKRKNIKYFKILFQGLFHYVKNILVFYIFIFVFFIVLKIVERKLLVINACSIDIFVKVKIPKAVKLLMNSKLWYSYINR